MFFRRKPPANPYVKQDDANTYRVRIKTRLHGDTVELRFTKSAHIGVSDDGGYVFRKQFVSDRHFDRGEVTVQFDSRYNVTGSDIEGGELIPVASWS
ncbi:hypothetical protein [Deinococcus peraridilitoris]|uniref:Uncharacterized protein n=1 Tax=Deinococcus peraridilitoris (strain DSM 19664 / LMG 22246 / CIP 109416 / KR-200) TaxID=937777 RepID=L0A4M8_DEIPD|nr:hypothetical protein [Deinococcus peraridilitoris]AFZ68394.1 hypothetical protein Deipe_2937 [Deinococcus peraridilitoris DSM 19664]